jgi:hypothetical protein
VIPGDRDRSWLTRGYFNPAPWARTIAPLVAETEVTFYRETRTKNDMGGFTGEVATDPYLVAMCHVEVEETSPYRTAATALAPIQTRHFSVLLPIEWLGIPIQPDLIPQKGDRVAFVDALGRQIDTPINTTPEDPVNALDHLELQTDEFE